jgi:amino acid transporter
MLVGAAVSTFGNVSGMTLAAPRALYALARDGFMPAALARIHPSYKTPHVAIAVQSALAFALALTGTFEKLAILANLALLVVFAACAVASWELRRRDVRSDGAPFRVPGGALVPILGCLVIAGLLTSIRPDEWAVLAAVVAVAVVVFFVTRGSRARRVAAAA